MERLCSQFFNLSTKLDYPVEISIRQRAEHWVKVSSGSSRKQGRMARNSRLKQQIFQRATDKSRDRDATPDPRISDCRRRIFAFVEIIDENGR